MSFVYLFTFREPAVAHMNDQGLTDLYGCAIYFVFNVG